MRSVRLAFSSYYKFTVGWQCQTHTPHHTDEILGCFPPVLHTCVILRYMWYRVAAITWVEYPNTANILITTASRKCHGVPNHLHHEFAENLLQSNRIGYIESLHLGPFVWGIHRWPGCLCILSQRDSNAHSVSMSWRHNHDNMICLWE